MVGSGCILEPYKREGGVRKLSTDGWPQLKSGTILNSCWDGYEIKSTLVFISSPLLSLIRTALSSCIGLQFIHLYIIIMYESTFPSFLSLGNYRCSSDVPVLDMGRSRAPRSWAEYPPKEDKIKGGWPSLVLVVRWCWPWESIVKWHW